VTPWSTRSKNRTLHPVKGKAVGTIKLRAATRASSARSIFDHRSADLQGVSTLATRLTKPRP
jgi:hypothetical protein